MRTRALGCTVIARVIDEHLSHDSCGDREEVSLALPPDAWLIGESEECLVDERRRIQRVAFALALELPMGNRTQLGIDERNDLLPRDGIVAPLKGFEIGGLGLLTHRFRPPRICAGLRTPIGGLSAFSSVYRIY
jgi:hypothetical protein